MDTARKVFLVLALPLLSFALFFGVTLWSLNSVAGQPDNLKRWAAESGVYAEVSKEIINQSNNVEANGDALDPKVTQKAIKKAITPEFLQTSFEEILNGTYAWLQGKTEKPAYNIDTAKVKKIFAGSVEDSALKRLSKLPPCTLPGQATTTDPFEVNCRPSAAQIDAYVKRLNKEISSDQTLLPNNITAETTQIGATSTDASSKPTPTKPWYEQWGNLQLIYKLANIGPIILGVLAVLLSVGIVFAAQTKHKGARMIARTILTGSLLLALSAGAVMLINSRLKPAIDTASTLEAPLMELLKTVSNALSVRQLTVAIGLAVLSIIALLILRFTKPNSEVNTPSR